MFPSVTKNCFPPAFQCHNCMRKYRCKVTEKKKDEDLKRCSDCRLMTYCDRDCQKEHWNAVHKRHCKFLSGKKVVANNVHNPNVCPWCIRQQGSTPHQIMDVNSPKTTCHIETLLHFMKMKLGYRFQFHGEGKTCGCSLQIVCNLPFALGEVSGQYIGSGIDEIVAHSISLTHAMWVKMKSETVYQAIYASSNGLTDFRVNVWKRVLIMGEEGSERPLPDGREKIPNLLKDLDKSLGSNNAWFKALKFSVDIVAHLDNLLHFNNINLKDLEDPRFQNVKKMYQYEKTRINNVLQVSQNKLWANFKMWPTLSGGELVLQLPEGIRCDSCYIDLKGQVAVTEDQETNFPLMKPTVGSSRGLVAICSKDRNPACSRIYLKKNPKLRAAKNENQYYVFGKEWNKYLEKSRACDVCIKNSLSAHRCSKCLAAQYCSTQCQMKDVDFHKTVCDDWAKDEKRKMMSSRQQKEEFKKYVANHQ